MNTSAEFVPAQVAGKSGPAAARSFGRAANWTVGIAAAVLVLISVGGYFYHRQRLLAVAGQHLRLVLSGPSSLEAGVAAEYAVGTTTITGQPLPAQVEVALLGPDGKRLKAYTEPADERGHLQVVIPADLPLPPQTRLKVAAWYRESREEAEMPLRVEPVRYATQLTLDKPWYQPGETVHYRSLTLSRLGLAADGAMPLRFEILAPGGAVVSGSQLDGLTERGVGHGAFVIPNDLAEGQYTLVVRSPEQAFPVQQRPLLIRRHGLPPAKTGPVDPGRTPDKIEVTFYPEGGELAAGLENRVYFVGRNSRGEPVRLSGAIVTKGHGSGGHDDEVAAVQTTFGGMGVFSFTPRAGETYRLKITSPVGVKDQPALPEVGSQRDLVLTTGAGVFAAGKPLEFNLRAAKAGLPLVVAAYCRGVQVGQQPLVTKAGTSGANPVAIALDHALGGVLRLTVFDYSDSPPKVVAERLVYRRPMHTLNIAVTGRRARYAPGEKVDLSLLVTNEKGQPVPATLGVAVVDGALFNVADDRAASLPTSFLLTGAIGKPEDLEGADFYLSERSKDNVPAAVALDLLLGTQGWRRLAAERSTPEPAPAGRGEGNLDRPAALTGAAATGAAGPPLMFDNLRQIRAHYEESLADYQAGQSNVLNTLTVASFFGGLGLVLLVAMLGLMRIVSGTHLWIPAVGATTCCLIIGAILMDPDRLATGQDTTVAFSSYHAPAAGAEESPPRQPSPAEKSPGRIAPPDSAETPFWHPLVIVGPNGKASVDFPLPKSAATFRVMIDAHGDGRLGFDRAEIVVHDAP